MCFLFWINLQQNVPFGKLARLPETFSASFKKVFLPLCWFCVRMEGHLFCCTWILYHYLSPQHNTTQQRSGWRKLVDGFYSNDRKWLVEWFWERCMGISGKNLSGTLTSFISLDRVHKRSDRWRTPTAPKIKQQKLREVKVRESKDPTASTPSTLTSLINVDCVDKSFASQHQLRILTSWISSLSFQRHRCLNH